MRLCRKTNLVRAWLEEKNDARFFFEVWGLRTATTPGGSHDETAGYLRETVWQSRPGYSVMRTTAGWSEVLWCLDASPCLYNVVRASFFLEKNNGQHQTPSKTRSLSPGLSPGREFFVEICWGWVNIERSSCDGWCLIDDIDNEYWQRTLTSGKMCDMRQAPDCLDWAGGPL